MHRMCCAQIWAFQAVLVLKNPPANAGDVRHGFSPWVRSPGEGNGNPLQYSRRRIPWTEEPGRLWSIGSQSDQATKKYLVRDTLPFKSPRFLVLTRGLNAILTLSIQMCPVVTLMLYYGALVTRSCPALWIPWTQRLLCPWDSPGQNTGVGCHSLLQGIFLTQGSNPGLLHCR